MISFNPIYCHTGLAPQDQLLNQHYNAQYKSTHMMMKTIIKQEIHFNLDRKK